MTLVAKGDKRISLPDLKAYADYLMSGHEDECPEDCVCCESGDCASDDVESADACTHYGPCADEDEHAEAVETLAFYEEAVNYTDLYETLILDDDFEEYAQEVAEELKSDFDATEWPYCHIDWREAADALKADYTAVEWGDTTYWVRG